MDSDVDVLIEALENAFDIKFGPKELTDESSLDQVYAAVRAHMPHVHSGRCLTSIVFWRLRRACGDLFAVPKHSIHRWTATELILPSSQRHQAWSNLSACTRLRLPGLEYSAGFVRAIFLVALVPSTALAMAGRSDWWKLAAVALWFVTANFLFKFLKRFADVLPTNSATFGGLTKAVVALNHGALVRELGSSRDGEMLESVRYLLADQIDLDPDALTAANPRLMDIAVANDGFRAQV